MKLAQLCSAVLFLSLYVSVNPSPIAIIANALGIISSLAKIVNIVQNINKYDIIMNKIDWTSEKIRELSEDIHSVKALPALIENLPNNMRLELSSNNLIDYITRIDVRYKTMQRYLHNRTTIQKWTLEDLAKSTISLDSDSIVNLLERIHVHIVPIGIGIANSSILQLLQTKMKEQDTICYFNGAPQQIIMELYQAILMTELKGYAMIQYSYAILKSLDIGDFSQESIIMKNAYRKRFQESMKAVQPVLQSASQKYWRCDPRKFIKDENYLEITELVQGYVVNEANLNDDGNCWQNCNYYKSTTYANTDCNDEKLCKTQNRCSGRILHCEALPTYSSVCLSHKPNKRYDYASAGVGKAYGKYRECNRIMTKSWFRYLFWVCSYCICLCDNPGTNSDRYISLRKVTSDTKNNMVVTGFKFTKMNRVIHIQIQEAKLLPNGILDQKTVKWVNVDDYRIYDRNVRDGIDYHTLSHEYKTVNLDEIQGSRNELLTGVRFSLQHKQLTLEIEVTPVDFTTAKLSTNYSKWISNRHLHSPKIEVGGYDVPTLTKEASIPNTHKSAHIDFTHTGYANDFRQTTIPFLDSQEVAPSNVVPLLGAGIYHKATGKYGGFIGLNMIVHDVVPFIHDAMKEI